MSNHVDESNADQAEICRNCEHCEPRHVKPGINTSGEYVCMVLGVLIPDVFLDTAMCSGLYFDKRQTEQFAERTVNNGEEISAVEAAEILEVSRNRILQLCNSGQLVGRKIAGAWMVSRASVEQRRKNPPAPWRPKKEG